MHVAAKRILLVEDDPFMRRAGSASLRQRGWIVLTAVDGEEALALVQCECFDLILLDILMPKVTGIEVLRFLKGEESTRHIPVLVLSNSSREQDIQEAHALGVVGYFVKADLSLQELGDQVAELLED
jgi:CheY-like chemotaxis protein